MSSMRFPSLLFPKKSVWPDTLGKRRVRRLQHTLNVFFSTYLDGFTPLRVDGEMGDHTRRHIRAAKYYLGRTGKRDTTVNRQFMKRLRKPNNAGLVVGSKDPAAVVRRGRRRRRTHDRLYHEHLREQQDFLHHYSGKARLVSYDGKLVAAYFPPALEWARHTGHNGLKWRGVVVSGWRSRAYSEHLCYAMCGAPTCPGRCAGVHTNHVGIDPYTTPSGAVDLTDYLRFAYLMMHCPFRELGIPRIHNDLPNDRVHFSPSGR